LRRNFGFLRGTAEGA